MRTLVRTALVTVALVLIAGVTPGHAQERPQMRTPADSAFAARVHAAIQAASDVPADSLRVVAEASRGLVDVMGSVLCDDCGGNSTPGGAGTVQQSLGAVVRAVPGVERVSFYLRYRPSGSD